jgi:hypothetical protein
MRWEAFFAELSHSCQPGLPALGWQAGDGLIPI